jgi:hypothetical protein
MENTTALRYLLSMSRARLSHFITYVLVDIEIWNSVGPIDYDVPTTEHYYDFYFALDVSRNMTIQQ